MGGGVPPPTLVPDLDRLGYRASAAPGDRTADGDPLVHQRRDRDAPSLALAPDASRVGHPHIREEDLVEFGFAGDLEERSHLDTGRLHVHEERRHPLVLGDVGVRARHNEPERRDVRQRGPDLLSVEKPLLAVALGAGRQPGDVRSRTGLAEQLAPDLLVREEWTEVALLLFGRAVSGDGGRAHAVADGVAHPRHRGATRAQPRLRPLLFRRRQAEAARAEREVHPGQAAVELLSEKRLRRCRLRREVSQQAINELVDVRTHARTL